MIRMMRRASNRRLLMLGGLASLAYATGPGCQPAAPKAAAGSTPAGTKASAPSKVTGAVKEADLARLELTEQAEHRLGIVAVEAKRQPVPRAVSYAGEVMIPTGRLIIVASPFLGTVEAPPGAKVPLPGSPVSQGQPIFVVKPILSPEARATMAPLLKEADGQVRTAQEQLKIARIALDRAENAVRDKLLPAAALIDAKAQFDVTQTAHKAAEERRDELRKIALDPDAGGGMTTLTFRAPVKGILHNVHAQEGQPVPAAAPLFDVAELDPIWVRVPVYVGDLERLAADKPAGAGGLSAAPGVGVKAARPVIAPPAGDPLAATVFLYYEVENHDHALRPGQRVGVTLPLSGDEDSLAVPRSALIRDALGGTWVYETIAPHAYTRRRVFVDRVVGDLAALSSGLKAGAKVVSQGAAELYGAEFGGQK
jgi:cobalt-zinc-cadmium efflux system membrane fusion protein